MNPDRASARLGGIVDMPTGKRFRAMSEAHDRLVSAQIHALRSMTGAEAARRLCDWYTVGQVVGHVAAWERFVELGFDDLLHGARMPRVLRTAGWIDETGREMTFANGDQFSAYIAQRDQRRPWDEIRRGGVSACHSLRSKLTVRTASLRRILDGGERRTWRLGRRQVHHTSVGIYLWAKVLWHAGVAHAADIGLTDFDF